jgi:hypothetical protein
MRARGIEIYVIFFYLINEYDTVNHALLFGILNKYGIPEELVEVVKRMHNDCKVCVQVGKEKRTIYYLPGVQQGDNIAPVIFLFTMLAVCETMKKDWKYKTPKF